MSTQTQPPARLRSSLANAAWAVEERVLWGAGDALKRAAEVLSWPFERAAWAIERGLVWPLQERTADWDGALRRAGLALLILAAIGIGVAGLLWATPDQGGKAPLAATPPPPAPAIRRVPAAKPTPGAPLLHGAAPVFQAQAGRKLGEISQTPAKAGEEAGAAEAGGSGASASAAFAGAPAGAAAIKVAHRFAGAFVLYETGQGGASVRKTFLATATPELAHNLLHRPPRLPANVKVPKAKVLNLVPGPSQGGVYAISVSLLRLGLTSELRLDMEKIKGSGWRVTEVLG